MPSSSSSSNTPVLELRNVSMRFNVGRRAKGPRTINAVSDVSFRVPAGASLGLVGETGSGKSTVARLSLGLLEPTTGEVLIDGRTISSRHRTERRDMRKRVQAVFQDPTSSLNPRQTVLDLVETPLLIHHHMARQDRKSAVLAALRQVGLGPEHLGRYPHQLSGGQRQRVAIARALILGPALLIADEPTSSLDVSAQAQVIALLKAIQAEADFALLFISHNLGLVKQLTDWAGVMYLGRLVELGPTSEVFRNPKHPYTEQLLASVLPPDPKAARLIDLPVEEEGSDEDPSGCRFEPRCPHRTAVCLITDPLDVKLDHNHRVACHLHAEAGRQGLVRIEVSEPRT